MSWIQPDRAGAANGMTGSRGTTHNRIGVAMDTLVTLRVDTGRPRADAENAFDRALHCVAVVEQTCSRFDPASELRRLCAQPGRPVPVSPLLLAALSFAIEVARASKGAFDPTLGARQQQRGFARNYRTGRTESALPGDAAADYRDVLVDADDATVTIKRPLLLDLGAVAKGLAIDLGAQELSGFERWAVEAGGDLRAGGMPPAWRIGIPDPAAPDTLLGTMEVPEGAVCTSGGYERPAGEAAEHHILDPRSGRSPRGLASVTVAAPSAMVADALATAALVLGPVDGLGFLQREGVDALAVSVTGERLMTPAFAERFNWTPLLR